MAVIDKFLMGTIVGAMERHQHGDRSVKRDIVSIILDTMETSGQTITPGDIRDIVFAGMIAGRDTTADALSWLMHTLHNNPRVARKLRKEILAALPKFAESESYVPSIDEVQGLPYLEATIRELLRLKPSVPTIPYHCTRDTVFPDGTFVPARTGVMLSLYAMARLENVWGPDAASFVPERFIDAETGDLVQISPTPFVTFSAGPRVCAGRTLAMLELKLVATCVVARFHLEEADGNDVTYSRGASLGMKNPLLMKVERIHVESNSKSSLSS
ncbi:Cytochrome P450 [Phytophthora infestans]|uniref:Cytochrome P450 n=1 Tax=Phytophthora infestans TaxID=4787 RepID=A0A833S2B7_PHYIN|nr:Cytochrome P450 [Phytophthora infestans]KAF4144447.1 Cytochrome P450 [Phytophthora infestans]